MSYSQACLMLGAAGWAMRGACGTPVPLCVCGVGRCFCWLHQVFLVTSRLGRYFSLPAEGKHCQVWCPVPDPLCLVGTRGGGTKNPPRRTQETQQAGPRPGKKLVTKYISPVTGQQLRNHATPFSFKKKSRLIHEFHSIAVIHSGRTPRYAGHRAKKMQLPRNTLFLGKKKKKQKPDPP